MRTTTWSAAVGVVAVCLSGAALHAGSINVDFNNGGATGQSPDATAVVGPYATSGWYNTVNLASGYPTHWPMETISWWASNTGSPTTLVDNANQPTTAKFGFLSDGLPALDSTRNVYAPYYGAVGASDSGLNSNQQLYNGATNSSPGGFLQQISIRDVPYATYDVYLLVKAVGSGSATDAGLGTVQIFTGDTRTTAVAGTKYYLKSDDVTQIPGGGFAYVEGTSTDSGAPTAGANYVVFRGLTSPFVSFDIVGSSANYSQGVNFSGVQIVESVPEPVSLSALALGGVGLLARRRR